MWSLRRPLLRVERPLAFIGPSVSRSDVEHCTEVELTSPARRGDILKAARAGFAPLLLIDGFVLHDDPPSSKEITAVLRRGTCVYGAASVGALLAFKLRNDGMIGRGWVFESYSDGTITAGDEVLVSMFPETFKPLTVPLVNVRYALGRLSAFHGITAAAQRSILRCLSAIYFEERTPACVREVLVRAGVADSLIKQLLAPEFDIKRHDGIALIEEVHRKFQDHRT